MEVKEPSAKYLARPRGKQTEVGTISEDWCLRPMLSVIRIASGQVDPRIEPYRSMTLVAPDHIESGTGRLLMKETASDQQAISGKYLFAKGDIVYSKIRPYLRKAILADFEGLCSADMYPMKPAPDVSGGFVLATILGHHFSKYAESVSVRSGMPKINRSELAEYVVALPPTKAEQEAIAGALSDADALIESLERLLAKKRHLKQGAMQDLLTCKRRLPGFGGEWEVRALGDIATANKGSQLSISEMTEHGTFAHLNGGVSPSGYTDKSNAPGDSIAISEGGNSCGYVQFMFEPYWCGGHCYSVIPKGVDNRFLYHALKGEEPAIMSLRVGSGLPNVQKTALLALRIRCPRGNEEQTAIAAILSDMDAGISALEERLDKARQLKQGMMQELLTGRTRLVVHQMTEGASC